MRNAKKIIIRLSIVTGLILLAYLGIAFYGNVLNICEGKLDAS